MSMQPTRGDLRADRGRYEADFGDGRPDAGDVGPFPPAGRGEGIHVPGDPWAQQPADAPSVPGPERAVEILREHGPNMTNWERMVVLLAGSVGTLTVDHADLLGLDGTVLTGIADRMGRLGLFAVAAGRWRLV
jgi:hypothetical protein